MKIGTNVNAEVKDNTLTITIDLSADNGPSKSGKTTIIASTNGNVPIVAGGAILGLNVYKRKA